MVISFLPLLMKSNHALTLLDATTSSRHVDHNSQTTQTVVWCKQGALNEAMSDIFSAFVESFLGSNDSDIWLLGEDAWTPGVAGDALRYMCDPAAAGDSDYYPDRYKGTDDQGGVHTNSGIANLGECRIHECMSDTALLSNRKRVFISDSPCIYLVSRLSISKRGHSPARKGTWCHCACDRV
jgi:hypothetical protein